MRLKMPKKSAFVLMPFREDLNEVYDFLISESLEQAGYTARRADDIKSQSNILEDIIQNIAHSDLIVADLTGANPNVYYELGIAHALQRKVILMTQEITELPFDLRSYRVIGYDTHFSKMNQAKKQLIEYALEAFEGTLPFGNPVKDYIKSNNEIIQENNDSANSLPSELGILDLQVMLEDGFEKLKDIVEEVGAKLINEVTPQLNSSTDNLNNGSPSAKEKIQIVQNMASYLKAYSNFIAPKNQEYDNVLKSIEISLEQLLNGQFDASDTENNLSEFLNSLSELEKSAEEGKLGFITLIKTMKEVPKIEKNFDKAKSSMATELQAFVENIEKTIAITYRARRLGNNLAARH